MRKRRASATQLRKRVGFAESLGLSARHSKTLARRTTPQEIQDLVSDLDINREKDGDTCLSVERTLSEGRAHCIEGAFVAAAALWLTGRPPLLMDMEAHGDDDHVVAIFRSSGCWGAISKSNHIWLRWRDPVYRSLRELAMSYFHEYVREGLEKTLRTYSRPFDLRRVPPARWVTGTESCWDVPEALCGIRHHRLLSPAQVRDLRDRDPFEVRAGRLAQHRR